MDVIRSQLVEIHDTMAFSVGGGTPWKADFQHTTEYLNLDKDSTEWKAGT